MITYWAFPPAVTDAFFLGETDPFLPDLTVIEYFLTARVDTWSESSEARAGAMLVRARQAAAKNKFNGFIGGSPDGRNARPMFVDPQEGVKQFRVRSRRFICRAGIVRTSFYLLEERYSHLVSSTYAFKSKSLLVYP